MFGIKISIYKISIVLILTFKAHVYIFLNFEEIEYQPWNEPKIHKSQLQTFELNK